MGRKRQPKRVVIVEWDDAHAGEDGWSKWEPKTHHKARKIVSVGFVLVDNEIGISLCASKDAVADTIDNMTFIPRSCITEVTDVTPG